MEILRPSYFDQFHCIAGACPDSCCKEWAVVVDESSAEYYRQLPGDLGDALRSAMTEEDGDIILALTPDRRCPMWRDDGLCRIQAQLGEAALCNTCTQFPRLRHDYGTFVELGLELSCPEAARLILSDTHCQCSMQTVPGGEEPEYAPEDMEVLLRSREAVLEFLKTDTYTPGEMLAVMLLYGYAVQNHLDGGEEAVLAPETDLARARSLARGGNPDALLNFFRGLEILTPQWQERLESPSPAPWSVEFLALARYFVSRYWLQAISDLDLVGRVKLAVVSCLLIRQLGGDLLHTAQLFSKEIENDASNIDAILDAAYTSPALADLHLLDLLLS